MALHVRHLAMKFFFQPAAEAALCFGQVDVTEADLLKAEGGSPAADVPGERIASVIVHNLSIIASVRNRPD